jgi:putative ABC transport system substrate-binding protein
MILRRSFLALLGGAAAAWPVGAPAQVNRVRRIGVLMALAADDPEALARVKAFEAAWPGLGWIRGRNIQVDYRWAPGDMNKLRSVATDLVASSPEVILAISTPVLSAVRSATQSIPIVFAGVSDPDGTGVVASMARPGGNITGFANFEPTIGGKWLQALKEMAPYVTRVAVLRDPAFLARFMPTTEGAARSLGADVTECDNRSTGKIEQALSTFAGLPNIGIIVLPDPSSVAQRRLIIELAAKYHIPAVYPFRSFVRDGGLMTYGVDPVEQVGRAASYIERILKGEKPAELPVQAPNKFELAINLKTAKALGITVPLSLLGRADEVIE